MLSLLSRDLKHCLHHCYHSNHVTCKMIYMTITLHITRCSTWLSRVIQDCLHYYNVTNKMVKMTITWHTQWFTWLSCDIQYIFREYHVTHKLCYMISSDKQDDLHSFHMNYKMSYTDITWRLRWRLKRTVSISVNS